MTTDQLLMLSSGCFFVTAIASIGMRTLRNFSRHDFEEICRRKGHRERFGQVLRLHARVALGVEMLVVLFATLAVTSGLFWSVVHWQLQVEPSWGQWLAMSIFLGLTLVVAMVWIPWATSRVFGEEFLYRSWPWWQALAALVAPLVWGATFVDTILHRVAGRVPQHVDEETIEEEIRTIVTEGHREGLLEEDAREMIEGVIELGDADVSQIMTPRTDMHMVQVDMPWDEMIADTIEAGHTRVPIYDKNRDDIIGILYSKDLLPELATGAPELRTPIRDLVRKPVFVPETKPLDDLLQMFQHMRTHIAIVLDEYGGVSGLVTIEDVLEEIVGEIVDEYDAEVDEDIQRLEDNVLEALGRAHVDEINTAMNLQLPEDGDFDTIAGFVFTELGRVPVEGETIVWQDDVRIEVLEASRRRIERVRIERLSRDQLESA